MTGNTIPLPGGWSLMPPPNLNLPGLGAPAATAAAPDLSGLLSALAPALSAVNPQLAVILPIIGVLFQIGHGLSTQMQADPGNQGLGLVNNAFWSQVLGVFSPHAPAPTTTS